MTLKELKDMIDEAAALNEDALDAEVRVMDCDADITLSPPDVEGLDGLARVSGMDMVDIPEDEDGNSLIAVLKVE